MKKQQAAVREVRVGGQAATRHRHVPVGDGVREGEGIGRKNELVIKINNEFAKAIDPLANGVIKSSWRGFIVNDKSLKWINRCAWFVVVVTFIYPWILRLIFASKWGVDIHEMGTVGDYIGGTAAPFLNFASFLLLFGALKMQQESMKVQQNELRTQQEALKAQQEELKLTREEMAYTREVFQEQSDTMARQRFESTLFNMITLHNQNANSLKFTVVHARTNFFQDETYEGRKVIGYLERQLEKAYKKYDQSQRDRLESLREIIGECYLDYEHATSHYFKHLLSTIAFAQTQSTSEEEAHSFTAVIFAQLSVSEIAVLFYMIIGDQEALGRAKLYKLAKHIDPRYLMKAEHLKYLLV